MYEFVCKHKLAIEKLNYYEWAKYLEKINDDSVMDHLLTKIDKSSERENLSVYRRILFEEFENTTCFYCGKNYLMMVKRFMWIILSQEHL